MPNYWFVFKMYKFSNFGEESPVEMGKFTFWDTRNFDWFKSVSRVAHRLNRTAGARRTYMLLKAMSLPDVNIPPRDHVSSNQIVSTVKC